MKKFGNIFLVASLLATFALLSCNDDENPSDPGSGGGGITSAGFPGNATTLAPGGAPAVGALTGGTAPYAINTAPDSAVATAGLSGANMDTLTITPVAVGTTSVIIQDSSPSNSDDPTAQTVTINITVTKGGGGVGLAGSGTFSVTSSLGSLSASGTYVAGATSGQGVGGVRTTANGTDQIYVYGYVARSASDFDVAIALVSYPGTLMNGNYPFVPTGGMFGSFALAFGVSPENIEQNLYIAASGAGVNITSITTTNVAGNSSGSGYNLNNPTLMFTFEPANFNVTNYGTGSAPEGPIGIAIEKAIRQLEKSAATR